VPAGRFLPGAARERTANPPAGTVLAPPAGLPPEGVLSGRDLIRGVVVGQPIKADHGGGTNPGA
jgi:hypothetical protein